LGSAARDPTYPYFLHVTAELRKATFRVGESDFYREGHLTALDDPDIVEMAKQFEFDGRMRPNPKAWVWVK
jgi:hypothetical protein